MSDERLDRLERSLRIWQGLAVASLIALGGILVIGQAQRQQEQRDSADRDTRTIELRDNGQRSIVELATKVPLPIEIRQRYNGPPLPRPSRVTSVTASEALPFTEPGRPWPIMNVTSDPPTGSTWIQGDRIGDWLELRTDAQQIWVYLPTGTSYWVSTAALD